MAEEIERYRAAVNFQHKFENIKQQLSRNFFEISSPTFFVRNFPFHLHLVRDKGPAIVCALTCGEMEKEYSFDAKFRFFLITPSKRIQSAEFSKTFGEEDRCHRRILSEIFPGEEMIVGGGITLGVGLWAEEPKGMEFKPPKEKLRENLQIAENQVMDGAFASLLESGDFSDVNFVTSVDSSKVKAHKNILAARSQVFARMLSTGMAEAKDNEIRIEDMGTQALKLMLNHIYTGQLGFPKGFEVDLKICQELANAGEKYDLGNLKEYAAMGMTEFVSLENAWELLMFAKRLKAEAATHALTEYCVENVRKIIDKA